VNKFKFGRPRDCGLGSFLRPAGNWSEMKARVVAFSAGERKQLLLREGRPLG